MEEGGGQLHLTTLLIILVLGGWTEGSGRDGRSSSSGPFNRCLEFPISPNYCSFFPSANQNFSLEDSELCNFTLPQYACGLVSNLTASQLAAILRCHITDPSAQLDQGAFLLLFSRVDQETLQATLSRVSTQIHQDTIPETVKGFLLNAAWERLKTDPQVQTSGFLALWFQELLHPFLTAISTNVLDCMTRLPITCDGFTVVLQALDTRYLELDNGTKEAVAGWIGSFLAERRCPKGSPQEWIQTNWKRFLHFISYHDLLKAWGTSNEPVFLTDSQGGALEYMTPSLVAEVTAAHGVFSNISLMEVVARVLSNKDVRYVEGYLDKLVTLPLEPKPNTSRVMLETILRKVNQSFPDLCSPSLKDLFQVKLKPFLPAADAEILALFPTRIGCTDFQDMYKGINSVYSELDLATQEAVYKFRLDFLERQLAKEGVACTFATSNSKEWLQENFGFSSVFAAYDDFVHLNPTFNGFEALDLLTATQMASLVVNASILTDSARISAETEAAKVMEALQGRNISELRAFLLEVNVLAEQRKIAVISNVKVRDIILRGVMQTLKLPFISGFESWFGGILTLFLPSVTIEQLQALPPVSNCTQLQTIVKGLDSAFYPMSAETKTEVTRWIVQDFKKQVCPTTGDWISLSFQGFKSFVNLTDFMAMDKNFSGLAHLKDLSAVQLAQLTLTDEVCSSVASMGLVFDRLAALSTRQNLEAYWDEFNRLYEKPGSVGPLKLSMEVKHVLLTRTIQWLGADLRTFRDADYQLWFEKRLPVVLPSLTAAILQQLPLNMSCGAYKSVIAGLNIGFLEIPLERKRDVVSFIGSFLNQNSKTTGPACSAQVPTRNWLLQFIGKFSAEVSYAQLVSFYRQTFDAYVVLDLLTPSQTGDMIILSQTLTSVPLATQLVAFFQESRLDYVQTILKELSRAAIQHKMVVPPNMEVAQLLLTSYLSRASSQMATYTVAEWNATFRGELHFLRPVINVTTLAYITPRDAESIAAVVAGLSEARGQMAESTRRAVVSWIVQNAQGLKGYRAGSIDEWIQAAWGAFFVDATLEEVKSTNENFSPTSVLGSLSIGQLMEFVKGSDAPTNVTAMKMVLSSLATDGSKIPLSTMRELLTHFSLALEQNEVHLREDVRLEILSTVFTNLAPHFRAFTDVDFSAWFSNLKLFLPGLNQDLLQQIPLDLGFSSYTAIIKGLDGIYPELSQKTSSEIYAFMKRILEFQVNISGTAFPGAYKDSQGFLQAIFHRFAPFAKYTDFLAFYKDFNGYDVLPLLTAKQIGEMMFLTDAVRRELLAAQILVELEKRSVDEWKDFMVEFNAVAHQGLTILPDLRVSGLILEALFKHLQFSTFSAEQYAFWFSVQLQPFLPALSFKHLHRIPFDMDCRSHQNLVKALDQVYPKYTKEQKKDIHKRILNYLESYLKDQGVTCSSNANSSQWLLSNYGQFRALASLSEFSSLNVNFDWFSAMEELVPSQLADVVASAGALADGNLLAEIVGFLGTPGDVAEFLEKLNIVAPVELQSSAHASFLLSHAFEIVAPTFPRFKASDFTYWFQGVFRNILHALNETLLATIPLDLPCGSYQQMLKGFNEAYTRIPVESGQSIFRFCQAFLGAKVKSGVACGHPTQGTLGWLEVNLGNFSTYAEYQDLISWNLRFDGMAVLERLSLPQLASLALQSGAINEEEKMCQIMARLENKPLEAIYQFLDQFNLEAQKLAVTSLKEEVIRKKMLSLFMEVVGTGFSAFRPGEWTRLLSTRLALFLPSVGEKECNQILSRVSGCDSFRAVVSSLSGVYPAIPVTNQGGIYRTLFDFLGTQQSTTGSTCASQSRGTGSWLQENLGAFSANAPYEDLTKLIANFNGFEVRDNLTATQLAHVFFESGTLDSPSVVSALLMPLESRPREEMVAFVMEFTAVASQRGVRFLANPQVRDLMFQAVFSRVKSLFTTTSVSQYKDWFQSKLSLWLPSINASALGALPRNVPCGIFKIIMAGLEEAFQLMSQESRHDVLAFAQRFLATKTSQGGDPCTENTRGSLGWLRSNLASFGSLATYKDLINIYPDFHAMDAREGLTPTQLADYTLTSDVLRDNEKAGKIISSLTANNIGEFMDAFNAGAQQKKLSQLPHLETRRFMLGEIFCHLSEAFPLFDGKDYWLWFGERLHLFLSSLDARHLGFLPSDTSCDSLVAIVGALTDHHVNNTFENPGDIASFIKRVLHFQLENSGSACTQGISTDRQWLEAYFGPFSTSCSYSDFTALRSRFRGDDSLALFSASALAQLSTQSRVIYSRPAMTRVFEAIRGQEDPLQYLATYLDEFNNIVLKNRGLLTNPKVQHTVLMLTAEMAFPQFDAVPQEDAAAWLQKLVLLLPAVNGTVLELLPRSMPCTYYQNVVKALVDVYPQLSNKTRQEVYGFQKAYLTAQFADSGSACDGGNNGVRSWLMENLGDFCAVAKLGELQTVYPALDGIENPPWLSPVQAADLTLVGPMCNSTLSSMAVGLMKTFRNYQDLHDYLYRLQRMQCQDPRAEAGTPSCNRVSPLTSLAPEIQPEFFSNLLSFLKKQGTSMDLSQWANITQFLFPDSWALNGSHPSHQSPNGTCETFQATLEGIFLHHLNSTEWQKGLREVSDICQRATWQPKPTGTSPTSGSTTTHRSRPTAHSSESAIAPTRGSATISASSYPALFSCFALLPWALTNVSI